MSAKTIDLGLTEAKCVVCELDGIDPAPLLSAQIHVSASGFAQMLVLKCPTHGPIKRLYSDRPSAIFKALYPEFFTEMTGQPIAPEPKPTKWV